MVTAGGGDIGLVDAPPVRLGGIRDVSRVVQGGGDWKRENSPRKPQLIGFLFLRIGNSQSRGVRRTREASQSIQCVCTHVVCADNMETLFIPRH